VRRTSLIAALAAAALAAWSCDSTQPDRIVAKTASLQFQASGTVELVNCFEVWLDTDSNSLPDQNTGTFYCVDDETPDQRQVPWRYTLAITVIRAGTTTEELIATDLIPGDSIPDFQSMTPYDDQSTTDGTIPPVGNTYYLNGRNVSVGNPIFLTASGFDLGPTQVLGSTPSYDFPVNRGDTIIVRARKESNLTAPPYLQVYPVSNPPQIQLVGRLFIGGQEVQPNGTTVSSFADGSSVFFSFTVG